jgi:ribA/ribD-fused uncharacterized protein
MGDLVIPIIDAFRGEYRFLSNFAEAPTPYRGRLFPTSEHAYAAAKTDDPVAQRAILDSPTPDEAKRIGQSVLLTENWNANRFAVMQEIVLAKFRQTAELADKLVATSGALLVEGNTWHDQTWGSCSCDEHCNAPGGNALGVILMWTRMRLAAAG